MRWVRGIGIVVGAIVLILGVAAFYYWDTVRLVAAIVEITPSEPFSESDVPPPYDYSGADAWAALPTRQDGADRVPAGATDNQASAKADVFFVHPTTYLNADGWNAPHEDGAANERLAQAVLPGQASAFSECCRVYAPRYRQATFASFVDRSGSGEKAIALAYTDVVAAFDYYLAHFNDGRPFILAGHSQGSRHLFRLLTERIAGTPLAARMIAAFPVGMTQDKAAYLAGAPGIPVCATATETGCVVTWNSVGPDVRLYSDPSGNICVNPLTWKNDEAAGDFALNKGSLSIAQGKLFPAIADATCSGGVLVVSEIRSDIYAQMSSLLGPDNYHIIDYGLFWQNVRENAAARTQAFLARGGLGESAAN